MGFNIGSFLGSIAPAIGSLFGPIGAVLGTGVGAALARPAPSQGPRVAPSISAVQRSLGGVGVGTSGFRGISASFGPGTVPQVSRDREAQLRLPIPRPGFPLGPIIGGAIGGALVDILNEARQNTGRPVSARKIRDAARFCGLETAASMFGLTTEQVCQVIIAKRRRRRGISASDLRRTRSTIRKINTMRKSLKKLGAR